MERFDLRSICHVCTNDAGDRFVGIKADADSFAVCFPLGYQLPPVTENERELRRDITHLILVLSAFTNQKDKLPAMKEFLTPQNVDFPINAYIAVITDYMARSYYTETKQEFVTSNSGKIDWQRTVKRHLPIVQPNGSPIYTKFEVRSHTPNDNTWITRVHEYCVYEAFQKLGWLFTSESPREPQLKLEGNKNMFMGIIRDKMGKTFKDNDKLLFQSMMDMLNYLDERSPQKRYYFGTDNFEYVWEKMIDKAFGVKNKRDYFPRSHWRYLAMATSYDNDALEPDTIMIPPGMGKAFVLDAKYYRYGATGNPRHLPSSSSINKQITYGEHVSKLPDFAHKDAVLNAFIMPYNKTPYDKDIAPNGNKLKLTNAYESIGEAYGTWKQEGFSYEVVQGIVVDVRHLMFHYTGNTAPQIKLMADKILSAYENHRRNDYNI